MCQDDIQKYLKGKRKPVDIQELITNIPANRSSISRNCKKLRESREVKFIKKKEKSYEKYLYFL